MALFDTDYWSGGGYDSGGGWDYGGGWDAYSPSFYDDYDTVGPAWDSMSFMPGESSGMPDNWFGGAIDKIGGWLGQETEGGGTVGSNLLNKGLTGGLGLLLGMGQNRALEKARKKQREWEEERARNAGKLAAQQRLDYINGLRQDPNFRRFDVEAPDRDVTASGADGATYGQGGEHMFFDPEYLSRVKAVPQEYACGGLARLKKSNGGMVGGQDDVIDAKLTPGEYVLDADTVSSIGDGSTEAGAARLDAFRERLRAHKSSGGLNSIPPRALEIEEYLNV